MLYGAIDLHLQAQPDSDRRRGRACRCWNAQVDTSTDWFDPALFGPYRAALRLLLEGGMESEWVAQSSRGDVATR